jgi:ATP-dependent helicase/DNAse subunit B
MEIEEDSMVVLAKKMMENRKELRDKGRKRKKKKKKAVWSSWNSLIEVLLFSAFPSSPTFFVVESTS